MTSTETAEKSKKRKFPIWARITVGALLFILLALVALRFVIGSGIGRNLIESQLESRVIAGQEIQIDGLEGDLLDRISLERLVLSDEEGVWAEAQNLTLDWSPWPLIGRNLRVDLFSADSIEVYRRPVLPQSENNESSGEMPLRSIVLSELALQRIALSEGVVPREVEASVFGDVRWTPDDGDLNVQVEPADAGGDRLIGDIRWTERDPLQGEFELDAPEGGLFATLLRLADGQSLDVRFNAEGEMSAITATLDANINGADWISLNLSPSGEVHEFDGQLDLELHPDTRMVAERIGPELNLSGEFNLDDPISTLQMVAQSAYLTLDVSEVRRSDDAQSVSLRLQSSSPNAIIQSDALRLSSLNLAGDASMIDGIVTFDGDVRAGGLATDQAQIEQITGPLQARYGENRIELTPRLRAENLTLSLAEEPTALPWLELTGEAAYNLETSRIRLASAEITTPQSRVRASGSTTLDAGLAADLNGDVRLNLAEFGLYESGIVEGRWAAVRAGSESSDFSANLEATDLPETEALSDWLGESVTLEVSGTASDAGAIEIPDLRLVMAAGNLTGNLSRSAAGELDARAEFLTGDSYPLAESLPGAQVELTANGPMEALNLTARLEAVQAGSGENVLDDPRLRFDGLWSDGELNGEVQLEGVLQEAPLRLTSNIGLVGARWAIDDLNADWRDLTVRGIASGDGGDLDAITADLRVNGELPDGMPAQSIDLNIHRELGDLRITGDVVDLTAGPIESGDLNLDVSGTVNNARYDLELVGLMTLSDITQETKIELSGSANDLLTDTRSTRGTLDILWGQETIATREPFNFRQSEKGIEGSLSLSVLDGDVSLNLSDNPDERARLTVSDIEFERMLQAIGRAPLDGSAEFSLTFQENGEDLVGQISGELRDVAWPERDMSPVSFLLDGELENEVFNLQLSTPDSQALNAFINANYPVTTSVNPISISPTQGQKGEITAELEGVIDNILALFVPDQLSITGEIDAELSSQIPYQPDELAGRLQIRNGSFEHSELGAVFQNINFNLNMERQTLQLSDFSAEGRSGGTLNGSGSLGLVDQSGSNLQLQANQLVVVERHEGRAVASGKLGLEVQDDAFVVNGDLVLDEGQIYIDRLPSSGVTTLDVQFEQPTEEDEEEARKRAVRLDIGLTAPRRLQVDGAGMDAELSLDSRITGTADDIQINGEGRIVRGRFELLGKRFSFVDSVIRFDGDPMTARLDIEAERDTGEFLAKVNITGTPRRPEVSLSAEPDLPEDEVLSRVLFGRSPSQLTGLEAARLAAALAQLSGGGGFDLMGGLENLTGLDRVDVTQDASGQFMVATGRYLTDDVYLEVTSNASGSPGVSVEWEARDNISIGAETVAGEGQNLSIQWKKDFD